MRVIVYHPAYSTAVFLLLVTSLYMFFYIEDRKSFNKKTYFAIIIIVLAMLGISAVSTIKAKELRDDAVHNLTSYPITLSYNCNNRFYITLPVKINTSLVIYKANTNISLLYNITRTVNPDRRPEVFVDPGVFNTSNGNGSELVIYPKMWDYPNRFVESFRSSIDAIPGVGLVYSYYIDSATTRTYYINVGTSGRSYTLGKILITMIPLVPREDAIKLALATKLLYIGIIMDLILGLLTMILIAIKEDYYTFIIVFVFPFWFLGLLLSIVICNIPVTVKKYNEDYYYLPCSAEDNTIYLQRPLADDYYAWGKSFPVAGLRDYALGHPDTIIVANLPNNVLFIGRAGLLSRVDYPLLYKGVVSPSVAEKYVKNVIVGEVVMDGDYVKRLVINKPTPIGELLRNINNVTINEFPLGLKMKYNLYLTGVNDTLFRIHGTLGLSRPLENVTLDELLRSGVIQEWVLKGITPTDAIKTGTPDYVIRVVPIGISHYRWTS